MTQRDTRITARLGLALIAVLFALSLAGCASKRKAVSEEETVTRASAVDSMAVRSEWQQRLESVTEDIDLRVVIEEYAAPSDDERADSVGGAAAVTARQGAVTRRTTIEATRKRQEQASETRESADSVRRARADSAHRESRASVRSDTNVGTTGECWGFGALAVGLLAVVVIIARDFYRDYHNINN